jgi:hypothetical protein
METIGGVKIRQYTFKFDDGNDETVPYVIISEIPDKYRDSFCEWLGVATCPMIPGCNGVVYSWDWERFFNLKTKGILTMWD